MNEISIQQLVECIRLRHIRADSWPGKQTGADAMTLYPNIVAELCASDWWLGTMAAGARVSPEIMAAVIEDKEALEAGEMLGLARCWCLGRKVNFRYWTSPKLAVVDPLTNKGKRRRRELLDLMAQADAAGVDVPARFKSDEVAKKLKKGEPITYASWYWGCSRFAIALATSKPKPRRITRMPKEDTST